MNCSRCGGIMINERFLTPHETEQFRGWRCPICGDIVDEVILFNRSIFRPRIFDKVKKQNKQKKQTWHRGASLEDVGRPLSLNRAEKEYHRVHTVNAAVAPRNRIGEGR